MTGSEVTEKESATTRTKEAPRRPDLDTLYCVNEDGSHRTIHPADVRGRWQRRKKIFWTLLFLIYVALPIVHIGGHPALFIDIPERHFYAFGGIFNAGDFNLFFFIVAGVGLGLIIMSALFGRVWCGYACPQTVFLEGIFRRIERWIDGSASKREKLERAGRGRPLGKLLLKHGAYLAVSIFLTHVFLSYFFSIDELLPAILEGPGKHPVAFGFVTVFWAVTYYVFAFFREQVCLILCPYGRLQSALYDEDTIQVGYDRRRGEPRGHHRVENRGSCIDCYRCVAVCPTGIDIRNGTQLECVGCANCIDACDEVMEKIGEEPGLVRYDSQRGFETGKRRFLRPRLWIYTGVLFVLFGAFGLLVGARRPFDADLLRMPGPAFVNIEGRIRNNLRLQVSNKLQERQVFDLHALPLEGASIVLRPTNRLELESTQVGSVYVFVEQPQTSFRPGRVVEVEIRVGERRLVVSVPFLGPEEH